MAKTYTTTHTMIVSYCTFEGQVVNSMWAALFHRDECERHEIELTTRTFTARTRRECDAQLMEYLHSGQIKTTCDAKLAELGIDPNAKTSQGHNLYMVDARWS